MNVPRSRGRGEESEFRAFVVRFSPTLVRAAYLLVRDPELAQDVTQMTLERTFRRWRVARSAPEAYSRRVLVNVCRNHWRGERRRPVVMTEATQFGRAYAGAGADAAGADADAAGIEDRLMLQSALATLPELQREVLITRFFLELSVAESAECLRVPVGTVKSATHRALAALREQLSDSHPPQEVPHAG